MDNAPVTFSSFNWDNLDEWQVLKKAVVQLIALQMATAGNSSDSRANSHFSCPSHWILTSCLHPSRPIQTYHVPFVVSQGHTRVDWTSNVMPSASVPDDLKRWFHTAYCAFQSKKREGWPVSHGHHHHKALCSNLGQLDRTQKGIWKKLVCEKLGRQDIDCSPWFRLCLNLKDTFYSSLCRPQA